MKKTRSIHYALHEKLEVIGLGSKGNEQKLEDLLQTAYAPYSNYPVASIVVMEDNTHVVGTNQENAAFPDGLCGERVAVLAAKAAYPSEAIKAVYIMTGESERAPAAPCGSCRQVLHETEMRQSKPLSIILNE